MPSGRTSKFPLSGWQELPLPRAERGLTAAGHADALYVVNDALGSLGHSRRQTSADPQCPELWEPGRYFANAASIAFLVLMVSLLASNSTSIRRTISPWATSPRKP